MRLEPAERRAQLVALGLAMLSDRPLDQVVVDEIAAAAGISRGLLFHYFKSKREFHIAVASAAAEELLAATTVLPVADALRSSLERYVDYVEQHQAGYVSLIRGSAGGDPDLAAVFEGTRRSIVERVLAGLGLSPSSAPGSTVLTVRGWVAFSEEATIEWLRTRSVSRAELVDLLEQSLVRLLGR